MTHEPAGAGLASSYVCETCGQRSAAAGSCGSCGEPLLNLGDEAVRMMLVEADDRRVRRREHQLLIAAVPLAALLTVLLADFVPPAARFLRILPFGAGYLLFAAALGFGLGTLFGRLWPARRRFPDLA